MPSRTTPMIKFCATGKSGLGHLRRVTNVARAIRAARSEARLVLITNAPVAGLSADDCGLFSHIHEAPRERMASLLASLPRGPVVVDTAVLPGLEALSDPLILILRETVEAKLAEFRLGKGRLWDLAVVPSPQEHWQPDRALVGVRHVVYAGWICRTIASQGPVLPEAHDNRPRLLVATGGGGTKDTAVRLRDEIDAVLGHLRSHLPDALILQAAGPRLPAEGRLTQAHDIVDVGSRLNEAFAEADAVVSTVGYNSVLELAALQTPALLVPISRTFDDQEQRAILWGAKLGLAHEAGASERSAQWLSRVLEDRARRMPVDLGAGAAEVAGHAILKLVPEPRFEKPVKSLARARSIVEAARFLKAQDAPVLDLALDDARELLLMTRIEGEDLRKIAAVRQRCSGHQSLGAIADLMTLAMSELAAFHRAGQAFPAGELPAFDPFAKVRPRLQFVYNDDQRLRIGRLAHVLEARLARMGAQPSTIVHGDFHVGQVLVDGTTAATYVVDLDDVAIGNPASDVGNFAAHVVTASSLYTGPVRDGIEALIEELSAAYRARNGALLLDPIAVSLYASAALLRRLLKLYVAGAGDLPRHPEILAAAERLHDVATAALQRAAASQLSSSEFIEHRLTGAFSQ